MYIHKIHYYSFFAHTHAASSPITSCTGSPPLCKDDDDDDDEGLRPKTYHRCLTHTLSRVVLAVLQVVRGGNGAIMPPPPPQHHVPHLFDSCYSDGDRAFLLYMYIYILLSASTVYARPLSDVTVASAPDATAAAAAAVAATFAIFSCVLASVLRRTDSITIHARESVD